MPDMKDIHACVVCGRTLKAGPGRTQVDTCGERCRQALLRQQRAHNAFLDNLERLAVSHPHASLIETAARAVEEIDPDELERFAAEVTP
jgi:predicted nucleic acid-binding Zn ribbon protein